MKTHTRYLTYETHRRREYINMTAEIELAVRESGIAEGLAAVCALNLDCGIFINDNESGFIKDLDDFLEHLVPEDGYYRHNQVQQADNGDAHVKSAVLHQQVVLAVTRGVLDIGPWQQVFFAEMDGCKPKRVVIKVLGE